MSEEAFVTSDLHLGAGKTDDTSADFNLEDFFQDKEFALFLGEIARPDTTLFINGDFIDFAQIAPFNVPEPTHLLWHESQSLDKLNTAIDAHEACFEAIGKYLSTGARLRIIIGNHDLDLAWPSVQRRFRDFVGKPSEEQLRFNTRMEEYHGIVIEHGHSFTPENCPAELDNFIHEWGAPGQPSRQYLERVWGTDFMLRFYNALEKDHSYADNVKPTISVLYHGLKKGWIGGKELVRLLVFLKRRGLPWKAIASAMLSPQSVASVAPPELVEQLQEEAWRAVVVQRLESDPRFYGEIEKGLEDLPPSDRALFGNKKPVEVGIENPDLVAKRTDATLGLFRDGRERRCAKEWLKNGAITGVVFGHTHEIVDGDLEGALYNPGTWLPHLNLADPVVREKINAHGLTLEMLKDDSLYVTQRRAVHIVPSAKYRTVMKLVEIPKQLSP